MARCTPNPLQVALLCVRGRPELGNRVQVVLTPTVSLAVHRPAPSEISLNADAFGRDSRSYVASFSLSAKRNAGRTVSGQSWRNDNSIPGVNRLATGSVPPLQRACP